MNEESRSEETVRTILSKRIRTDPRLTRLSEAKQAEIVSRILAAAPYKSWEDLVERFPSLPLKGLKKQQRLALLDVLKGRLTRRGLITAWGLGGLAAASVGAVRTASPELSLAGDPLPAIRPLLASLQQRGLPVGQMLAADLASGQPDNRASAPPSATQLVHALDMSNWTEAAAHLEDRALRPRLAILAEQPAYATLLGGLEQLRRAWDQLHSLKDAWRQQFFIAYAFGKLPGLASATPADAPYDAARQLQSLGPLFHALEIFNQRLLSIGRTRWNAPLRVTQGHNLSYAHLASDLGNPALFAADRPPILVNWDAHADLGPPFENSRMPLENPMAQFAAAQGFDERVVVASSMSIGGWIGPLLEHGLLHRGKRPAEVAWVVPPEAAATSAGYVPAYGAYELLVGSLKGRADANGEPRIYSAEPRLRRVASPELLTDVKACRLYVVSPDDLSQIDTLVRGKQIALSIDVDFAGTREPGVDPRKGFLPHYPLNETPQQLARHQALIRQAVQFYRRWQESIRSITIANSPNFTVDEATRHPLARLLAEMADSGMRQTPQWLGDEVRREAPKRDDMSVWIDRGLAVGGWFGMGVAATLAGREWFEGVRLKKGLFAGEA